MVKSMHDMGLGVLQQTKYGIRGQFRSNTGFQTKGRCRPLSRFMELLLTYSGFASGCVPFTSACTLKRTLMRVKSRLPDDKSRGVVYQIPCNNCDHVYTGDSKRTLKIHMAQHRWARGSMLILAGQLDMQ